jgi:DNA replicative helicase MCM subunit Mcm2 (Cdc46/Mcm family)
MILYESLLINLDYNPETDILFVKWPDEKNISMSELSRTLEIISDTLRHYDIKKMLLDASHATLPVSDPAYRETMVKFLKDVFQTRLEKFARLVSADKLRETMIHELIDVTGFTIRFKSFKTKAEALVWLKD